MNIALFAFYEWCFRFKVHPFGIGLVSKFDATPFVSFVCPAGVYLVTPFCVVTCSTVRPRSRAVGKSIADCNRRRVVRARVHGLRASSACMSGGIFPFFLFSFLFFFCIFGPFVVRRLAIIFYPVPLCGRTQTERLGINMNTRRPFYFLSGVLPGMHSCFC